MTNQIHENSISKLSAMTAYLKKGYSVIPVGRNKKPLISWKKYQNHKPTPSELLVWDSQFSDYQVGIVTGEISGLAVVDIEKEFGDPKKLGLPATHVVRTGSGGYHYYYKYVDGVVNKAKVGGRDVDIRGSGGYVVAPPSCNESGRYSVINEVAELPEFPVELFKNKESQVELFDDEECQESVAEEVVGMPDISKDYVGVGQGQRNDAITRYIGKVLPEVHPSEWDTVAWKKIVVANSKNIPPSPEDEVRKTFESIKKRECDNPSFRSQKDTDQQSNDELEILSLPEAVKRLGKEEDVKVYPTEFKVFDNALKGGFREGDLVVISGPSSHGKTTLAQNFTCKFQRSGVQTLWFSYEMQISELWEKFKDMGMTESAPAFVPFKEVSFKMGWLKKVIFKGCNDNSVKVVVIDHLGFLEMSRVGYDKNLATNYASHLGIICRQLKTLAVKNGIIVILLAHIRKIGSEEPTIEDLKDSSAIAQESDSVFMIQRIKAQNEDSDTVYSDLSMIKLEKNRRTGMTVRDYFEMRSGMFMPTKMTVKKTNDKDEDVDWSKYDK